MKFLLFLSFLISFSFAASSTNVGGGCTNGSSYLAGSSPWSQYETYRPGLVAGQTMAPFGSSGCHATSSSYVLNINNYGYDYCFNTGSTVGACPSCAPGTIWSGNTQSCGPIPLNQLNNDPAGCANAGGTYISTGTEQIGGTSYGASFFGGKGIVLGGDLKATTACVTTSEAVGQVLSVATGLLPLVSNMFKSNALKKFANKAVLDLIEKVPYFGGSNKMPDYHAPLPKLPAPNSTSMVAKVSPEISPVPTGLGGQPSRAPNITADSDYTYIPDSYIPSNTVGEPIIDYSTVDRANIMFNVNTSPKLQTFVPPVGTSSMPVKETYDLSAITSRPAPSVVASVPVTTTKTFTYANTDPLTKYTSTKTFPDGSSSVQEVTINGTTNEGNIKITTLSPTGETSTLNRPVTVTIDSTTPQTSTEPVYKVADPLVVTKIEGSTTTSTVNNSSTSTAPDAISNQPLDKSINAEMPSYKFPTLENFVNFEIKPFDDLVTGSSEMFSNISNQLSSTKTSFDNTMSMVNGGWTPPVFPAGSCGDSMAFNFHGKRVDFCPPMLNATSQVSPLVSTVVTIGGMALSVTIILGGF